MSLDALAPDLTDRERIARLEQAVLNLFAMIQYQEDEPDEFPDSDLEGNAAAPQRDTRQEL